MSTLIYPRKQGAVSSFFEFLEEKDLSNRSTIKILDNFNLFELGRVAHDVKSFSINPDTIVVLVQRMLL